MRRGGVVENVKSRVGTRVGGAPSREAGTRGGAGAGGERDGFEGVLLAAARANATSTSSCDRANRRSHSASIRLPFAFTGALSHELTRHSCHQSP